MEWILKHNMDSDMQKGRRAPQRDGNGVRTLKLVRVGMLENTGLCAQHSHQKWVSEVG